MGDIWHVVQYEDSKKILGNMKVSAGDFSQKLRNPKILGPQASWRPGSGKGLENHVKNLPLHISHNTLF